MNKNIKYLIESFFDDIENDITDDLLNNINRFFDYSISVLCSSDLFDILINNYQDIHFDIIPDLWYNYKISEQIESLAKAFYYTDKMIEIAFYNIDTSKCTDMSDMFSCCRMLRNIKNLSYLNTSNVLYMKNMFENCKLLESLDLSNFDTSNVINMNGMFSMCYKLESLDLSNFDTFKVTNMSQMFYGCESLESLNLSNFDTSNVTNMNQMFLGCEALKSLDLSNFIISNVTLMNRMFKYCKSLKYIKCTKEFRNWCWKNAYEMLLPILMCKYGTCTWDLID